MKNLALCDDDGERGVVAKKQFMPGELVLKVRPQNLLYGTQEGKDDFDSLVFWLFRENLGSSRHSKFLSVLPKSFDNSMLENIDLLPSNLQNSVNILEKKITACMKRYQDVYPSCLRVHEALFRWSYMAVNTRCVCFQERVVLAPGFDCLNHSFMLQNARIDTSDPDLGVCVIATKEIPIGDQVYCWFHIQIYIVYGPHDDYFLAVQYGFALGNDSNVYNVVCLDSFVPPIFCEVTIQELMEAGMWGDFTVSVDGSINFRLVSALLHAVAGRDVWQQFFLQGRNPSLEKSTAVHLLVQKILENAKQQFERNLSLLEKAGNLPQVVLTDSVKILEKAISQLETSTLFSD